MKLKFFRLYPIKQNGYSSIILSSITVVLLAGVLSANAAETNSGSFACGGSSMSSTYSVKNELYSIGCVSSAGTIASYGGDGTYLFDLPTVDSDGDGLPDRWEYAYFGNPTNTNPDTICANAINTCYEAFIARLSPVDSNSLFVVSITPPENTLSWNPTVNGRVYSIFQSTNLVSGFQMLETNLPWTHGAYTNNQQNVEKCIFYKVVVQLEQ